MPPQTPSWAPSVDDVAALLWSRTEVDEGSGNRTFSEDTVPTELEVQEAIDSAAHEVEDVVGVPVTEAFHDEAARLAARRAASLIATSLDDATTEESAQAARYTAMWLEGWPRLRARVRPPRFLA